MPLRISGSYDLTDEEEEDKKVHKKMSRKGHYERVRRPTNLEVYNDAAKILEELLEKRIDRNLKTLNRQKRNKTDPNTERVRDSLLEPDNPVARSKTMPSQYRESPNEEAKKREIVDLLKRGERLQKQAENGFVSSADTEDEGEGEKVMDKRRKKSLFKRAKERLIHTFNRDQKEGIGKVKERVDSPFSKRRKPTKKSDKGDGEVVSETSRRIKAHLNKDKSVDYTEEVEYRNKSSAINVDVHSHNSRSSSFSRNSLINTIRKPFRKHAKSDNKTDDIKRARELTEKENRDHLPPDIKSANTEIDSLKGEDAALPPPPSSLRGLPSHFESHGNSSSKSPSPSKEYSTLADGRPPHKGGLSSSSSAIPPSEHNSMGSLNNVPTSLQSNILDSPGEDIVYMDVDVDEQKYGLDDNDDQAKSIHASGVKFHTSEGLLNFNWLADQTADRANTLHYEIDERSVSRLRPDGNMEMTTTVTATRTVVMPDVQEVDEHDDVDGDEEDKPANKDELYGKIAQKLIAMADTYSASVSDPEMGATASSSDAPLTDLEKEIIACLRSKDKYSKELEDKLMEVTTSTVDDAYQRFRSTVQNSLGTELSWNHMAFLFYTTKGVVTALGKGSQAANQAKNFTLQYITDTCASWIMDQGGFDSMLSSSESDPEVD